jgi:hypothetical protein
MTRVERCFGLETRVRIVGTQAVAVLDRALRSEFSAPSELGRLADVFGRVREEGRE